MDARLTGWRRFVLGAPEQETTAPKSEGEPGTSSPEVAIIARGVEMNGRLLVPQSLHIEGEFRGELESGSSVFVAESGAVEAPIRARSVEIRGAVVGDIVATREVVIHATGRLHGNVSTPSLVVARGATYNGQTRMYRPERNVESSALPDRHAAAPPPESRA
jgi:cytoskeletal protein CcmA (bactofilin family)